jgi:hypothetical protein
VSEQQGQDQHPEGPGKWAVENVWAACIEIAKDSPLNADRMKNCLGMDLAIRDGESEQ